jgi:purine-binding chemotaxis protein CheW
MSTTLSPAALAGKYLTIGLGAEAYGIPVLRVREIIRLQKITPVPQMPEYVKGVINLRGKVIPIVDLRVKFGVAAEFADRTCIVVVQVQLASDQTVPMGLIVDRVEEVANLSAAEIEPAPDFGAKLSTEYMLGLAKGKGQVKTLLNLDRVIAAEMIGALHAN